MQVTNDTDVAGRNSGMVVSDIVRQHPNLFPAQVGHTIMIWLD